MTRPKSLEPKNIVAKIKAAQKLKRGDKKIVSSLSQAIKAGNEYMIKWRSSEDELAAKKYFECQDRILAIVADIVSLQKLEILLHSEIELIKGEIEAWEYQVQMRLDEVDNTALEALTNQKRALLEAENASMLLAIRRVPEALQSPLAVMREDLSHRPSPWLDSVTNFCSIEWAYFNRYLLYWGLSPSSHKLSQILAVRKAVLKKFIRLYLEFRYAVTPPQSEDDLY